MARVFSVKNTDLLRLRRLYKQSPNKMRAVTATIINNLAFKTRAEAIKTIKSKLTVRNESFIASTIWVKKTSASSAMENQVSTIGSVSKGRFSGLAEQELGTPTKRTRTASLLARGGNWSGQIKPINRLRSGRKFINSSDYTAKNKKYRTTAMLRDLSTKKYKKPFIIGHYNAFKPGLYRFLRKKIKVVQYFGIKNLQPRRQKWLEPAYLRVAEKIGIGAMWARALKKIFLK